MKKIYLVACTMLLLLNSCSMFHKTTASKASHKPDEVVANQNYLTHYAEDGETLHSLSKKYKVSVEEILTLNKDLNTDPKWKIDEGKAVKIPVFTR